MGNYFDTCLSRGDCNSFSTVANACELNKRVIYAVNTAGRVVGRKLLAINTEGRLVGFRTYTSMSDTTTNRALRLVFRRYCEEIATSCNLQLADDGEVPLLFAENWYDDGAVVWEDESVGPRVSIGDGAKG